MKKIYILLITATLLLFPISTVEAATTDTTIQQQIRVSPVLLNVQLSPGKQYHYDITIDNLTNKAVPIRLGFDTFDSDEDGDIEFGTNKQPSILDWTTVTPDKAILDPQGRKTISLTVTIPKTLKLGGYYGVLFVETLPSAEKTDAVQSLVATKVGVLLLGNIALGGINHKADIVDFKMDPMIIDHGQSTMTLRVKNTTLNHNVVFPRIAMQPLLGDTRVLAYQDRVIFPGRTRKWQEMINIDEFPYGIYDVTAMVSLGEGIMVNKTIRLYHLPIVSGMIAIATLSIALLLIIKRKRLKKVIAAFLKG